MKKTLTSLRFIFRQRLYRNIAISASVVVALLSYWLLNQTTTLPAFWEMMLNGEFGTYSVLYGVTFGITTLVIVVLSGISFAVMTWLFKHSSLARGKSIGANAGAFASGMLGMGCPICGAFLLSALGVAGGLSIFPLQGLEFKFLSIGLLAAGTVYGAKRVKHTPNDVHALSAQKDCDQCVVSEVGQKPVVLPLQKIVIFILAGMFLLNQSLIGQASASMGISSGSAGLLPSSTRFIGELFGVKTASANVIIAPKLNPDGRTTSLVEQPTITEVPGNPNTGNALADAKVVVLATGKPFYAPEDISFDDPINAQKKWGAYEKSITLSDDLEARYQTLVSTMVCSYCCGSPTSVTTINRCGCAHAKAVRGMFKFLLENYGSEYSDDQILGEGHRWYAIWYPKGMLEDYLLATGESEALPHKTHGGAGSDGNHGL